MASRVVATSLAAVTKRTTAVALSKSEELVCKNIMCAKLGEACVCRLLRVLQRAPQVTELRLDGNNLNTLPDLEDVLPDLELIDLRHNAFTEVPDFLHRMPKLKEVLLDGNPVADAAPR
mmetsp:Transcript_28603/g.91703  ORF Transcript_28603/g.91703 Transcript_28603/m.91703 type:complete len:119 (-) Transcript_28603:183-539(-)